VDRTHFRRRLWANAPWIVLLLGGAAFFTAVVFRHVPPGETGVPLSGTPLWVAVLAWQFSVTIACTQPLTALGWRITAAACAATSLLLILMGSLLAPSGGWAGFSGIWAAALGAATVAVLAKRPLVVLPGGTVVPNGSLASRAGLPRNMRRLQAFGFFAGALIALALGATLVMVMR